MNFTGIDHVIALLISLFLGTYVTSTINRFSFTLLLASTGGQQQKIVREQECSNQNIRILDPMTYTRTCYRYIKT